MLVNSDIQPSRQTIKTEAAHIVDCKNEPNSYALDEKNIMSLIIQKQNRVISLIIKTNQSMASPDRQMRVATLRDQVQTLLGAGHDITSTAVRGMESSTSSPKPRRL